MIFVFINCHGFSQITLFVCFEISQITKESVECVEPFNFGTSEITTLLAVICFVGVSFRHFHLLRYFFRPFKVCFHSRIQYGIHKSSRRFLRDVGCHVAGSKALRSVEPFNSCRSEITTALSCYQRRNRYNI